MTPTHTGEERKELYLRVEKVRFRDVLSVFRAWLNNYVLVWHSTSIKINGIEINLHD